MFLFNEPATSVIYASGHTLSRHNALPFSGTLTFVDAPEPLLAFERAADDGQRLLCVLNLGHASVDWTPPEPGWRLVAATERGWHDDAPPDRKSTRLNSSH